MDLPPPPTRKQLARARAVIAEQESRIARAKKASDEIQVFMSQNSDFDTAFDLESDQVALEDDIAHMQKELVVLQCYIAPIRRLPAELIGEIAVFVVGVRNKDIVSTIEALSMVCKLWRSVILSTPRIWTYIPWSNQLAAHPGQFIGSTTAPEIWLERSGKLRVDLFLSLGGLNSPNRCSPVPDSFTSGIFQRHSKKLRSVRVVFLNPDQAHIKRLMWAFGGDLLHVESLDVNITDQDASLARQACQAEVSLARAVPQLRSLHTSCFPNFASRWFTSVRTLRHLRIGTISAKVLVEFFDRHGDFRCLCSLVIDDLDDHTRPYVGPPVIIKVKLLSLGLRARGNCDIPTWLQFPQLEILQLQAKSSRTGNKAIATLRALMNESDPPLRELYLTNFNFKNPNDPARLLECLHEAPGLSRICIQTRDSMSPALLELLSKPFEGSWVCPELTELYIGDRVSKKDQANVDAHSKIQRSDVELFVTVRLSALENAFSDQDVGELVGGNSIQPVVLKPARVRLGPVDEYHADASNGIWHWTSFPPKLAWVPIPEHIDLTTTL